GLLAGQEKLLKAELSDKSLLVGDRGQKLLDFVDQYRQRLREGLEWLQYEAQNPAEVEAQFAARRKMVEGIVRRVNVFEDKTIEVEFVFDLSGEEIQEAPPWWL
ncbi:MAG TPA: hypothetical protein VK897_14795, partial [Anaerolineales bacterium]|nr:hypothetical protein [Anaerolineales bacterium]